MHHARQTLKDSGYRLTPQRTHIWEVLRERGEHMTADEIARAVQADLPDVNVSTVYRTLDLLVRLDLVTQTRLGGATSFYEVAPNPVHHHWVCERCGHVGHLEDEAFLPVLAELEASEGFAATRIRATVFGLCAACRSQVDAASADRGEDLTGSGPGGSHAHP